jgi:hypothetical protein
MLHEQLTVIQNFILTDKKLAHIQLCAVPKNIVIVSDDDPNFDKI